MEWICIGLPEDDEPNLFVIPDERGHEANDDATCPICIPEVETHFKGLKLLKPVIVHNARH